MIRKILRLLTFVWHIKATVIKESRNLSSTIVDELIGSLMTYELKLKKTEEPEPSKKMLALKAGSSKQETSSDESSSLEKDSDEFAMFTKNFMKFLRREGKSFRRKFFSGKKIFKSNFDNLKKSDRLICYYCRRSGHIQPDCP